MRRYEQEYYMVQLSVLLGEQVVGGAELVHT
jgi:hypothetical protein